MKTNFLGPEPMTHEMVRAISYVYYAARELKDVTEQHRKSPRYRMIVRHARNRLFDAIRKLESLPCRENVHVFGKKIGKRMTSVYVVGCSPHSLCVHAKSKGWRAT